MASAYATVNGYTNYTYITDRYGSNPQDFAFEITLSSAEQTIYGFADVYLNSSVSEGSTLSAKIGFNYNSANLNIKKVEIWSADWYQSILSVPYSLTDVASVGNFMLNVNIDDAYLDMHSGDIIRIYYELERPTYTVKNNSDNSSVVYTTPFGIYTVDATVDSENTIEGGIFAWVKNIFNKIVELPTNIGNHIGTKLTDLGNDLLDGIKGLFIPSEQDIIDIKADFEEILEDRFGAVYESSKIVNDFANSLNSSASTSLIPSGDGSVSNYGSVSFPEVTVNLAGTPFSFGGWNVQLKYSGFEALYDALRLITNICATFMVINAMKSRLEGIIR